MKPRRQTRTISRMMVPTDFSPGSVEALEYAIALAKRVKPISSWRTSSSRFHTIWWKECNFPTTEIT